MAKKVPFLLEKEGIVLSNSCSSFLLDSKYFKYHKSVYSTNVYCLRNSYLNKQLNFDKLNKNTKFNLNILQ